MSEIEPGDTLYGFCEGYFGRDSYGEKVVLAVGRDWIVARENGRPVLAVASPFTLQKYLVPDEAEDYR